MAGDDWVWPADNTGLEYYDLSIPWGHGVANWPYFEDVKIERVHYHAKSRVLTQRITTVMHSTTHVDVPAHVIEGTPFLDEIPLHCFFGPGVVVSIPKEKWEVVTPEDLEKARPEIQPGDIVIVNTGWHHTLRRQRRLLRLLARLLQGGRRVVRRAGGQGRRHRHPGARPSARHGHRAPRPGWPHGLLPWACQEYKEATGRDVLEDFPLWEPCHRALLSHGIVGFENVGGDIDAVTGKRVTFAAFPWRWMKGDGCIIRLVAMLDPTGEFRIAKGTAAG